MLRLMPRPAPPRGVLRRGWKERIRRPALFALPVLLLYSRYINYHRAAELLRFQTLLVQQTLWIVRPSTRGLGERGNSTTAKG